VCGVQGMIATDDGSGYDLITRRAVIDGTMPPNGALSDRDRAVLQRWAELGYPKGTRQENQMPTVEFVKPAAGDTIVSSSYTVEYQAGDADGDTVIWDLHWSDDQGGSGVLARDLHAGSGTIDIDTSTLASGTYTLEAVAVDGVVDAAVTQAATGTLTVPAGRNAAPIVAITAPADGALFAASATVSIAWSASDPDSPSLSGTLAAIRSDDGSRLDITSFATLPASNTYAWSLAGVAAGTYVIELTVSDGTSSRSARSGAFAVQGTPQQVSFATQVQPILTASCAVSGCHNSATVANKELNLSAGASYASLVGVASAECAATKRVAPGSPSTSYLMWKLQGTGPCFSGSKMPKTGSLSAANLALISDWIANGAPNN